jgi:hypothetical protein
MASMRTQGRRKTAFSRDWPSIIRGWASSQPWKASQQEHEMQMHSGIGWRSQVMGTEVASFDKSMIWVGADFMGMSESVRRSILYHEVGHALETKASSEDKMVAFGLSDRGELLDLANRPDAPSYNYDEIIAEGYAYLLTGETALGSLCPPWVTKAVTTLARQHGFPT